ncbi:MAG: PH domain-containing protein [Anaerolineae bacterium]|jgi:hypothetical protein
MGYVEDVLGDKEQILHRTHQHLIVLIERVLALLFTVGVFLALGLAILLAPRGDSGNQVRFVVGLIALGSLILPVYVIISAWVRGLRGEELVSRIWRSALAAVLILVAAILLLLNSGFTPIGWVAVIVAALPLVEAVRIFLDWSNEQYIITNRRVMEVRGIINKHVRDSALEKVNDVELDQSVVGRLLNYGTVQIITGSDIGVNMFRRINNPVRFKRAMLNAKEELQVSEDRDLGKPEVSVEAVLSDRETPDRANITDLIEELADLRKRGILSEEEFQAKKKELLARL